MAVVFIDGFDKYHRIAAAVLGGDWNTTSGNGIVDGTGGGSACCFGNGAFGGDALFLGTNSGLFKSLPGIYPTLIWGLRFYIPPSAINAFCVRVGDGTTAQLTVRPNDAGFIEVRRGGEGGVVFGVQASTLLATSTTSITASAWHYLEAKITIDHAVGAFDIYLDGVNIISATNQDTQFTTNSYISSFTVSAMDFKSGTLIDDLYIFDTTTDFNNDVAGDSIVETQYPSSDSVVQMAIGAAAFGAPYAYSGSNTPGAGLCLRQFTPPNDCIINSISILPAVVNLSAKYKMVIYTDNSGAAGDLMSSGTEVIGTANHTPFIGNLTSPQSLVGGTPYWLGFITDSAVNLYTSDNSNVGGFTANNTYSNDAPATAPAMVNNHGNWVMWGNVTTDFNYFAINQLPLSNPLINYITNNAIGDEDQYNFPTLTTVPIDVMAVKVSAYCVKSDAGSLNVSLMLKSGSTDDAGTNSVQPATASYQYLTSYWNTDPNTGLQWDYNTVNTATSGVKIT